ncbi:uncharacterized protein LOC124530320 isoform X2 [Vanessa cardui]|uniref:uncharacterized protein LOC124530320 isoform X2 n=1 Tax=Vanessa cardui TaxID=171605 RepID=UPI001F13660A|nr:uncharacterized protein LOC124530320 isoform X2 [Vanessa cardui]
MGDRRILFLYVIITAYLHVNHGCSIDGIPNWFLPENTRILDTDRGVFYRRSTTGIEDLVSVTHRNEGLNGGPYVTVALANSELTVSTHDNYETYEEIETALSIGFTAIFRCTDGSTRNLVFNIDITDTNNNDPVFKPTNSYEITIAPPVPPNFLLTNCINDIIVRDIDLTTERIDFTLEGSPLFEIAYDDSSTVPKEFKATLRTTTFIRSIPESITLTITATDVDRTGDSRRTATATVKVLADTQFELPDEPIFSQPFYIANYTKEHEFVLQDTIYLRQGYDSEVKFSLEGQYFENFELVDNGNQITFNVKTSLPDEVYQQREIYLTVVAEREYTSGANAMIVLLLPEETEAEFNKVLYNGKLEDGVVSHETITVSGYDGANIQITGAHQSSFEVEFLNGVVTIRKAPSAVLPAGLTHIALTLQAGRATAVLLLDVIDSETEASFSKVLYNGKLEDGVVSHETITIVGYDGTDVEIIGTYATSFEVEFSNGIVTIRKASSAVLPVGLTHVALTLQAGRASAVLLLDITDSGSEIETTFSKVLYNGEIKNGVVAHETITISRYDGTSVQIIGAYESLFEVEFSNGVVTIRKAPSAVLPVGLTHVALTLQAGRASAVLLLDITDSGSEIEATFSKAIYDGKIENGVVSHETITLFGYEGTSVQIVGAHQSLFEATLSNGIVTIRKAESAVLPGGLTHIALTLQAGRANAVLLLDIDDSESASEETFSKVLYKGRLENGEVSHETITISGYEGTNVQVIGTYESLFEVEFSNGIVTIRKAASAVLPVGLTHVALTLQAGRANAVLLLDITDSGSEIEATFSKVIYDGKIENGVVSHETITLFGYDGTGVQIIGAHQSLFEANLSNGIVTIRKAESAVLPGGLTHIALTLQAGRANAVLLLDIDDSESASEETFSKVLYKGKLENGEVSHETITISEYEGTNVQVIGTYESLFEVEFSNGIVTIRKAPSAVLPVGLTHVALTLQAGRASAVLLLDITDSGSEIEATFSKAIYDGKIENGVVSHETITLFGYDGTSVQILGAHQSLFEATLSNGIVTIRKAESAVLPGGLTHIALTLQAGRANAVLLLDINESESATEDTFSKVLYKGNLENGEVSHETITISGYEGTNVQIIGTYESLFEVEFSNGIVTIRKAPSAVLPVGLTHVALTLQAGRASAVLLLDITDSGSEIEATFSKAIYDGKIENGVVSHETITIFGYDGMSVQIIGGYESLFEADFSNGVVTIRKAASAVLPDGLTHIALTLHAGRASAVLLLDITNSEDTAPPAVTFSRTSYFLWADINQSGVVGRVQATAENGEAISYSLDVDDDGK